MKSRFPLLISGVSALAGCEYSTTTNSALQQPSRVTFYVDNGSPTQRSTDLLIRWDTAVVAQDTFRYTGVADQFQTYQLLTQPGEHHIRVVNSMNQLKLDSTIQVHNQLTHVFIGFDYEELTADEVTRIKQKSDSPEQAAAVIAVLSNLKHLSIHIMEGPISIP